MKDFNKYIETNQWLKKLMDELSEEDGMRLEDAFYAFKQHCSKAENLPISNVSDSLEAGQFYMVRCEEKDDFEPAKAKERYENGKMYFHFTDGSVQRCDYVIEYKPLCCR